MRIRIKSAGRSAQYSAEYTALSRYSLAMLVPKRGQREIRKGPNRKNDTWHSRRMSSAGCRQLCGREARLLDEVGEEMFVRYKGEPCKERHEFIRDYLQSEANEMKVGAN